MIDEGYIKFFLEWERGNPLPKSQIQEINQVRMRLFDLGLIGYYQKEQVGYGNLSQRSERDSLFVISGTQTGHIRETDASHYAEVLSYDLQKNSLKCRGPVKASSESMTHAMFYELDADIGTVLHVHHEAMWEGLLFKLPTTAENVPYGTPEMAFEIRRLWEEEGLQEQKFALMAGHREGVFSFGKDLEEALQVLLKHFDPFSEGVEAIK